MDALDKYLDSLDNRISKIEDKLDPVFEFVIKEKDRLESNKNKFQYVREIISASIAAAVAAIVTWRMN